MTHGKYVNEYAGLQGFKGSQMISIIGYISVLSEIIQYKDTKLIYNRMILMICNLLTF